MSTTDPAPPEDHPRQRPEPPVPPTAWTRPESPFRAPEPIRDLIAAINDKARAAQTGLFTMMALGIYIIATSFSTTDLDLLMEKSTPIAQLGVQIPVVVSFAIAPVVFLALHVFTLVRYHLLSHDLRALTAELDTHVPDPRDRARCRRLLANTEFVQAMTAQPGTRLRAALLKTLFWTMVGIMPVCTLLIVEISALRLQEAALNDLQRLVIVADLALLFCFAWQWRPLRTRRPAARQWRDRAIHWLRSFPRVGAEAFAVGAAACVIYFIHVYAVPPGARDDTVAVGRTARDSQAAPPGSRTARLRKQPLDLVFCPSLGLGCRYLSVEHQLIVGRIWDKSAIVNLRTAKKPAKYLTAIDGAYLVDRHLLFADLAGSRLYGAKLAYARLQHADLDHASMQGADIDHASMQGADLQDAWMQGADLKRAAMQGADLNGAWMQGADLDFASMQGADLDFASMQGADLHNAFMQNATLYNASMQNAVLYDASMQNARLNNASMKGADLSGASMQGISLYSASMQVADLSGALMQGANLGNVSMQGADLSGALMQGANLYNASMEGAVLSGASMQGTYLYNASMQGTHLDSALMQGTSLYNASMQGAILSNTSMEGADLRRSRQYGASGTAHVALADLRHADYTTRADGKAVAEIAKVAAAVDAYALGLPGNTGRQRRVSLEQSERNIRAAQQAGAPLPTYDAAWHSVLVVIHGRHGRELFPPRLRPFIVYGNNAYSTRLAKYLASHAASWGPAAAAQIARDRALDATTGQNSPQRARAIGCALLSAKKVSFAGYEDIKAKLKKKYPRSVCHPSAAHSPSTGRASKAPAATTRHAAN